MTTVDSELEGTELPPGEYRVAPWEAYLWADATRNDTDAFRYDADAQEAGAPGQLIPHSMCQHIVFEATGGVDETMRYVTDDWTSGAALGGLRATFHAPLTVGETLAVEGQISNVSTKEGSTGLLHIVTFSYTVSTSDGSAVYDLDADLIIMEGNTDDS